MISIWYQVCLYYLTTRWSKMSIWYFYSEIWSYSGLSNRSFQLFLVSKIINLELKTGIFCTWVLGFEYKKCICIFMYLYFYVLVFWIPLMLSSWNLFFVFCQFLYFPEPTPKKVQNQGSLVPLFSGSLHPYLKVRTYLAIGSLYLNLKIRTDWAVLGSLLSNINIPANLAVHGSLHPFLKIWTNLAVHESLFQNKDRLCSPWIPESLFKNSDQNGGPWIPSPLFKYSDQNGLVQDLIQDLLKSKTWPKTK